ncbi:maleylacetate reductase [Pseudonocardia sp.]|uniref:maleylacetate reductase n=1 Tax=Pseudonocardia sp. TaxID=60912 RepID=UPI003D0DDD64
MTAPVRSFDHEFAPTRIVFGPGRSAEVGDEVARLGTSRAMVIMSGHAPGGDTVRAALGDRVAVSWHEIAQHVPADIAARATASARDAGVDVIVSLGGGSATGLAKAVALELEVPIVAVPTTYAGSELTPVYGMTGGQRKRTGSDERVRPRVVLYDPELTVGLPAAVTGPSTFNALAHCFAAMWSPAPNPLIAALAADGVRTLWASLPVVTDNPTDLDARAGLQYGAFLAGTALGSAGTGLQHRISHALGGRLGLVHADTHSVVLPYVVALNTPAAPDMVARVRPYLGDDPGHSLWELAGRIGLPRDLAALGATDEALDGVADDVADTPNPVPATRATIRALLERAYRGREWQ